MFVRIQPCDVFCPLTIILSFSCSCPVVFLLSSTRADPFPCFLLFPLVLWEQGIPHSVMPPLPKRPALEKVNGATSMFSTGMLQYQQALANMQFQQQAAFIPSGRASEHCFSSPNQTKPRGTNHKHTGHSFIFFLILHRQGSHGHQNVV